ncbi:Rne/Rng family ribonuclease [uncultured Psychrobacter sp.]|uniref:Rne/Rng family ribonuclease n=1 Tax=uncultured Psychrobacter sp. TaxID=259303 RepID=UPI003459CA50
MKRILINATQNEEIRVALCKGNHLYDFDLENRTREQKKSNIYKGHVTRVEPSLEAVFVEYGSQRQGFLPIREISAEYLSGNPRDENIKKLIKEGDELIVQVEKEERGNKGAALSTYVSLAGRYLVLMPNNPRGGGISRQISGKLREDMKRMLSNLDLPKGMSVIIRTAGIGKTQEDLQHDLNHLLNIWQAIQEQNQKYPSPRLVHQEAGVVTRAVRDYLRDDISEIWIDNENAYIEAAGFIDAVMPTQADKLRKYTDYEPMFARFNVEKQIETAYQREVRLPSGGSIVIDQTEALVSIDINSAKSTKGSDVAETAYHTNLEAADEIARQLRLRDMGGLIVIDFIDMNDNKHQKEVEKRLVDATKYDRARVQFGEISKFGLMEMSRQRLRPSLEESTGYICPRCHGNGMIRDLRSLSLSIMRQIEQIALKERQGEVQAEVPTDIAAFILNEKRDSLVYLEQDSGTRITILPHAHLESPNFKLHFNRDGFAPTSYERITDTQQQEHSDLGYDVDWQTAEKERPEQQPTRQPRKTTTNQDKQADQRVSSAPNASHNSDNHDQNSTHESAQVLSTRAASSSAPTSRSVQTNQPDPISDQAITAAQPQAVAWLSNLFAQAPQARTASSVSSRDAAEAIEALVNTGAQSLGTFGDVDHSVLDNTQSSASARESHKQNVQQTSTTNNSTQADNQQAKHGTDNDDQKDRDDDKRKRKSRKSRSSKSRQRKESRHDSHSDQSHDNDSIDNSSDSTSDEAQSNSQNKRSQEHSRNRHDNQDNRQNSNQDSRRNGGDSKDDKAAEHSRTQRKPHSQRSSRGKLERGDTLTADDAANQQTATDAANGKTEHNARRSQDPNEVTLQVNEAPTRYKTPEVVHLSLDNSKSKQTSSKTETTNSAAQTKAQEPKPEAALETAPIEQSAPVENLQADKASASIDTHTSPDATNGSDTDSSTDNGAVLTQEALFNKRYVTAKKFGQASNDPRVVRRQQLSSAASSNKKAAAKTPATIRGSVGDFIHATLADAQSRLANKGIISCFIDAIEAHTQQLEPRADVEANSAVADNAISGNDTDENFVFSNYGYQPLDADYLARFDKMTQAVSQFAAAQGKTEVVPSAIGKRASNDPRGQHPDYQSDVQQHATLSLPSEQVEQSDQDVMQQQELEPATDTAQTFETAEADASGVHIQEDNAQLNDEAHDTDATALTNEAQASYVSAESEHLLEADQAYSTVKDDESSEDNDSVEPSKEDIQAGKSKTTIASYKNMIENVAEQLLPQTSMFNLTTPRVPKARSRKPKTEHKKPTQAEKLENDINNGNNDNDNDESNSES